MKKQYLSNADILSIMNSTVNSNLIRRCQRVLKERGYSTNFDNYVMKWILC